MQYPLDGTVRYCYCDTMDIRGFAGRLKKTRELRGIGSYALSRKIGKTGSYVSMIETGARLKDALPAADVLELLARELGVSEDYLKGKPDQADPKLTPHFAESRAAYDMETASLAEIGRTVVQLVNERRNIVPGPKVRAISDNRRVPVINGMSATELASDIRQVEQWIEVPAFMLNGAKDPVAYIIVGDCLFERWGIKTGDTLIVDAANTDPRDGQIVAARINDTDETAKEFYRVEDGVDLRPTTKGYSVIEVRSPDQLLIIGVYVTHLVTGKR